MSRLLKLLKEIKSIDCLKNLPVDSWTLLTKKIQENNGKEHFI